MNLVDFLAIINFFFWGGGGGIFICNLIFSPAQFSDRLWLLIIAMVYVT